MAFVLPKFNLVCDIYSGIVGAFPPLALAGGTPRIAAQTCALAHGRLAAHVHDSGTGFATVPIPTMSLLLPKGVDVRGRESWGAALDQVECPPGSNRWYCVTGVDDVGKGYPNEYRLAYIQAIIETWHYPYP